MNLIKGISELRAYQEAYKLALEVRPLAAGMPKTEQFGGIADQMRRASAGICANLAEGMGKNQSKPEMRRFVRMALGSVAEMEFWLQFARDCSFIKADEVQILVNRYNDVGRMLNGLEKSLSDNSTRHETRNTSHA